MRLSKSDAVAATEELLSRLGAEPAGLPTSEFPGSPRFHGHRTLTNQQIIRLLRKSGKAVGRLQGIGRRTWLQWTIK
jgi:hypothetical protein